MTNRVQLLERITPVFRRVFDRPDLVVTEALSANEVEQWDSLNHITLIVELEQEFKFEFSTEELAEMLNVGDLIDVLLARGAA